MRILIAVGCDSYRHLNPLAGAEEDAKRIWNLLTTAGVAPYELDSSALLLSPSLEAVREEFRALPVNTAIDVLTLYFAGHGGTKAGSYYFCLAETEGHKLATTGLALSEILGVITELKPRQANLVIDACQSAGGMYDFAKVLREEALEAGTPMAITVLAACGSRELAAETTEGGLATTQLLGYLAGDQHLQSARPFFDLIEVGRAVSADLGRQGAQTPVVWGVNLTGAPEFAANPFFDPTSSAVTAVHLPPGIRGKIAAEFGDAIARLHSNVRAEASGAGVITLLSSVVHKIEEQGYTALDFIEGVTTSLLGAASESNDLLAPTIVIDSALAVLLSARPQEQADALIHYLLEQRKKYAADLIDAVMDLITAPHYEFLNHKNVLGDLFYLPIRATGVLGWMGSIVMVDRIIGKESPNDTRLDEMGSAILAKYPNSIVAISDQQAVSIYVFVQACRSANLTELAETVLGCLYTDLVATRACVARPGLDGRAILKFLQERAARPHEVLPRLRANPSNVLSAVLLCAAGLELDDLYDYDLKQLDHRSCNIFIPKTFEDFGFVRIDEGVNYGFSIGHSVWTLADVRAGLEERTQAIQCASSGIPPYRLAAAMLASLAMPDRLPLFLAVGSHG